ncbi:MAG: LptF/LptG family permease, partial [Gammaproteobacteria bacterium]|nr:LptF/LptG family permease [Gammaproteobacteria bacterium]
LLHNQANVLDAGGIWAKDGPVFLNVREMNGRSSAQGIYIFRMHGARQLVSAAQASSAVFNDGTWTLKDLRETYLTPAGATTQQSASLAWRTFLSPGLLGLFVVDTDSLSARGLYSYIEYLHANDINAARYVAAFWGKVAQPVSLLAMLLLALPFVFGPLRSASAGQRLVTGMLIGIGFYVFNSIFMQSGVVFGFNPVLTAWLPTVLLAVSSAVAVSRIH